MEINSRKPKEWVGIINEPNYIFTITCVCVLLIKGSAHLPCLLYFALLSYCITLLCLVCSSLPLPHFVLPYLPCLWLCLLYLPLGALGNTSFITLEPSF